MWLKQQQYERNKKLVNVYFYFLPGKEITKDIKKTVDNDWIVHQNYVDTVLLFYLN